MAKLWSFTQALFMNKIHNPVASIKHNVRAKGMGGKNKHLHPSYISMLMLCEACFGVKC